MIFFILDESNVMQIFFNTTKMISNGQIYFKLYSQKCFNYNNMLPLI